MKRHAFSYLRIHFSVAATRSPEGKLRRVHSSRTFPWCKYTSLWCSDILRRDIRYAPDTHSRLIDGYQQKVTITCENRTYDRRNKQCSAIKQKLICGIIKKRRYRFGRNSHKRDTKQR